MRYTEAELKDLMGECTRLTFNEPCGALADIYVTDGLDEESHLCDRHAREAAARYLAAGAGAVHVVALDRADPSGEGQMFLITPDAHRVQA